MTRVKTYFRIGDTASAEAARELAARGYTNVRDYEEGKRGWIGAGLPYESKD